MRCPAEFQVRPSKIVGLCASHIDGPARLRALQAMLDSVAAQTRPVQLWLSISSIGVLEADAKSVLKDQASRRPWLQVLWRCGRLAQFEHYARLCADLEGIGPRTWCLFTDDDDNWHPTRAQAYFEAAQMPGVDSVIVCACGRHAHGAVQPAPCEYFEFAARFDLLASFCSQAPAATLALRGCDLVWRNVMWCTAWYVFRARAAWLYWQNVDAGRMAELGGYIDAAGAAWQGLRAACANENSSLCLDPQHMRRAHWLQGACDAS